MCSVLFGVEQVIWKNREFYIKWIAIMSLLSKNWKSNTIIKNKIFMLRIIKEKHFCHCCCSVTWSCPTLCNPMDCSIPGFLVHHHLPELIQTHVHWVSDAIQPSYPLSSPSPATFDLSQHKSLLQWINSLHQVTKILGLQL